MEMQEDLIISEFKYSYNYVNSGANNMALCPATRWGWEEEV